VKLRSTAILLVILALLGGTYYWFDIRGARLKEEQQAQEKSLFSFKQDQAQQLIVARPEQRVVLSKDSGKWRILEPVQALADSTAVDGLISDLAAAKKEQELAAPADLKPYGLAPPQVEAEVHAGGKTYRLLFGDSTPTGGFAYAIKPGGKQVLLVNQTLKSSVDKKLIDLRDKTIFDLPVEQVQELHLERGNERVVAKREGPKSWKLTAPIEASGDPETIRTLLTDFNNARIKEFVDGSPATSKAYGLDAPTAKVSIWVGQDRALRTLLLGSKDTGKDGIWATHEAGGEIFLVSSDLLDKVQKPVKELRDRRILPIERDRVAELEWDYQSGPVKVHKLEKDKEGTDHWQMEAPLPIPADASSISSLLFDIEALKAEEFVTNPRGNPGLSPPDWKLTVRSGDRSLVLAVGKAYPDQPWTYVRGPAGQIVAVKNDDLKRIQVGTFELRQKLLLDFRREQLEKVEVAVGGKRLVLEKKGDRWQEVAPDRRQLNDDQINDLIWSFDYVQMEKVFEEKPAALAPYGLAKPAAEVAVWTQGGKLVGKLQLGAAVPAADSEAGQSWVYAYVAEHSPVCAVEASTLKSIREAASKLLKTEG
jgi:hypothetical protein